MTGAQPRRSPGQRMASSVSRGAPAVAPGAYRVVRAASHRSPSPASVPTPATGIADDFNRADTASGLGVTSVGSVPWVEVGATWGIASNEAYCPTDLTNAWAVVDCGSGDGTVQVDVTALGTSPGNPGLVFRYVDTSNYWWVDVSPFDTVLERVVAGVVTDVALLPDTGAVATWAVVLAGSSITVKRNGTTVATVTDSAHATATRHGLQTFRSATRFDNFSYTP